MKPKIISLILMVVVVFYSCQDRYDRFKKSSTSRFKIDIHNSNVVTRFHLEKIKMETELSVKYIGMGYSTDAANEKAALEVKSKLENWNFPYDIRKDTALTIDKYITICKVNNYDPYTYLKSIEE